MTGKHPTWVVDLLAVSLVDHQGDELLVLSKIILHEVTSVLE